MANHAYRVAVVLTHPIQYFSSWFRYIAAQRPEIDLTVIYAVVPTPEAQGTGFDRAFEWDVPLLDGYKSRVLSPELSGASIGSERFAILDAPGLHSAISGVAPDAVIIPGWHANVYRNALAFCRSRGIATIYRGDSNLMTAPRGWKRPVWRMHTRRRLHDYAAWLAVGRLSREYLASFAVLEPLTFNSPHAVDNAQFAGAAATLSMRVKRDLWREGMGLRPDAFVALFAGKLVPQKAPLDAIRAVARLPREANTQLLMVGSGPLETVCRREAAALGAPVVFAGFLNQSQLAIAYGGVDCLVLPSRSESWGLVINEAMAAGLPAIVTSGVGAAHDLTMHGETGEVVEAGDVTALAKAIDTTRQRRAAGFDYVNACRTRVAAHSFASATDGVLAAMRRLALQRTNAVANRNRTPRVIACCGSMVIPGGLERMTFEVLRTLGQLGAATHVIVNTWESSPIVAMAEDAGASWSTGYYWQSLSRHLLDPRVVLRSAWEAVRTSGGLLRDARQFGPTHVLLPEFATVLRNAPALWWLRRTGTTIVLRMGNAPTIDRLHRWLWRWMIDPLVHCYVPNSMFIARELERHDIPKSKITVVYNTPADRRDRGDVVVPDATRVIYVGQLIPQKGLAVLLEAIAFVAARGIAITLHVVGAIDGWESPAHAGYQAGLRQRATAPDLIGRVTFLGAQDNVAAHLAAAAVHCCPSRPEQREGLAGVVLEAKQAGIPSVVTPSGSLPELVRHSVDGWITDGYDAVAIADGLMHFLCNAEPRRVAGLAARQSLETFSRERFVRDWAAVFGLRAETTATARTTERRAS
jgi:glycosyltransferase involved in cell wall biosynthesis